MTDSRDLSYETNLLAVFMEFVSKLAQGNPGAMAFTMELLANGDDASRDMAITALKRMDAIGIRGAKLYMLWNDCCGRDSEKAVIEMLNRSTQDLTYALIGGRGTPFRD